MAVNYNQQSFLILLAAVQQQQQQQQRLLESLFAINQNPNDEALELIAQRVNSTSSVVASWFQMRRDQVRDIIMRGNVSSLNNNATSVQFNNSTLNAAAAAAIAAATAAQHQQLFHQQQHQNQNNIQNNNNQHQQANANNSFHNTSNASPSAQHELSSSRDSSPNNTSSTINRLILNNINSNSNNIELFNDLDDSCEHIDQQQQQQQLFNNHHHHHHHHHSNHSHLNQTIDTNSQVTHCPSSTLLAKLNAVTSRPDAHLLTRTLDSKMIDLLDALYAINDNPEPSAIDMISKRINVKNDILADWFDKKRLKLNPFAGPRSPPVNKKREGGRVVTFSEYQRSLLEAIFNENNYLHPQEYEELSKLIQVPSRNIKIWFKNRRSKQRLSSSGVSLNNNSNISNNTTSTTLTTPATTQSSQAPTSINTISAFDCSSSAHHLGL